MALDIENTKRILFHNVGINRLSPKKVLFKRSDLFSVLSKNAKFDAIIANLPQHALPATPFAKKLRGKYGGYDGTDLVCRALTEGAYYLKRGGSYFGSVSRLTNFKRTMALVNPLYKIKIHKTIIKTADRNEMVPCVDSTEFLGHLKALEKQGLIEYKINKQKLIEYKVHLCEFILK